MSVWPHLASVMCVGALPPMAPLPPSSLAEHVANIDAIRQRYPRQTSSACGEQCGEQCSGREMEDVKAAGACSLSRLVAIHTEISRMAERYTDGKPVPQYGDRKQHLRYFRRALRIHKVKLACEVGFNAGHGAALWLDGTDVERLMSFDLPMITYTPHAVGARQLANATFPGRVVFHDGDSIPTLHAYAADVKAGKALPCDLWYIDGQHQGKWPHLDLEHAIAASHNGTLLIMDDCTAKWPAVVSGWVKALAAGHEIQPVPRESVVLPNKLGYNRTGWCAGMYVK